MIDVVIGAAYGDEGKGRVVSSLVTADSTVVRFNGGCQAGHTVVQNGSRHIFSHFGAGTLAGARTFLSRFFVASPTMFHEEWKELESLPRHSVVPPVVPVVLTDVSSYVTTPYDAVLNILAELSRSVRHGSVGVGFGETIERCERNYKLTVGDLYNPSRLRDKLFDIRSEWVPERIGQLKIDLGAFPEFVDVLTSKRTIHRFLGECEFFRAHTELWADRIEDLGEHLVFEGAQGLKLDQDDVDFPHVSRSHTGLKNVKSLVGDAPLNVYYLTRSYTTRHGAGPLPFETEWATLGAPYGVFDRTNARNQHQGSLRFSYLNLDTLRTTIAKDLAYSGSGDRVRGVMTWCDVIPDNPKVILGGAVNTCDREELSGLYESDILESVLEIGSEMSDAMLLTT